MYIYASCTKKSIETIEDEFTNKGYGDLKSAVAEEVIRLLEPIQKKYNELINSTELDNILTKGAQKATVVANNTLTEAKKKMGLLRAKIIHLIASKKTERG